MLTSVKVWLSKKFIMKDLGEASYILGIKIYRDRSKRMIRLSQWIYIKEVLKRFSMKNSKRGLLPLRHSIHLSKKICPNTPKKIQHMSKIPYASTIWSLIYAMLCIRPDIAFVVSVTSRYQSNLREEYWIAVKNILKYWRRTKNLFLIFGKGSELKVEEYNDLDFMSDIDDKRSTSGVFFYAMVDRLAERVSNNWSLQIRSWKVLTSPPLKLLRKHSDLKNLLQS